MLFIKEINLAFLSNFFSTPLTITLLALGSDYDFNRDFSISISFALNKHVG